MTMSMKQRLAAGTLLLAGGALAGGLVAGSLSADAANGNTSAPTVSAAGADHDGGGGHAGETAVTGSKAATLKAAALKAVPGGTVDRIETDSGDAAYEVHMTKSDGSQVTVKFDSSLARTAVESGMGR
jgi:uncharacterized membrane protein YkoI